MAEAAPKGRYRELGPLAEGGMAELFAAVNEAGAPVVVKRIRPPLCFDASYQRLFADEGHLAACLDHPNIVRLLDKGEDDAGPFLVFERVDGTDLGVVLDGCCGGATPVEIPAVLGVFIPLLRGLHAAHEAAGDDGAPLGLVHRDVSPGNVLLSADGDVKLADFGVAKSALKTDETVAGEMKGKFAYMAPEQSRGQIVDRRADLFATGVVLWECLTGRRLFDGPTDADVVHAVREAAAPDPSTHRPDIPEELSLLCLRLLAKDPAARPATAAEVADALYDVATDLCLEAGLRRHVAQLAKAYPRKTVAPREGEALRRRTQRVVRPDLGERRRRPRRSAAPLWVASLALVGAASAVGFALRTPPPAGVEALPDDDVALVTLDDTTGRGSPVAPVADEEPAAPRELPDFEVRSKKADEPRVVAVARPRASRSVGPGPPSTVQALERAPERAPAGKVEAGFGRLFLNSSPWANVKIDGADLGAHTPVMGLRLAAGPHVITLTNPHYKLEKTLTVVVPKDGEVRQMVDLTKR